MAYDSTLVVYTNVPLLYISVTPGMNLQTILQNINTAVNTMNPAPDYSGYNLGPYNGYSITQTDGVSHPTDTQNFAEGISKIVCNLEYTVNTFIGTTYASNLTILSNAISALQVPGLSYTHNAGGVTISIANTDTQLQVLTSLAKGIGDISDILGAPGTTWSTLSISTPSDINTAFDSLIAYASGLNTAIGNKEAAIGTFDNSSNCLATIGGTNADSAGQTITLLTTYVCNNTLSFDPGLITSNCLSPASDLQDQIQKLVYVADNYTTYYVAADNTSILDSGISGACSGRTFSINPTSSAVTKVLNTSSDTTPGYLTDKIVAGSNVSLSTLNSGGNEQLEIAVTLPTANQVAINLSDTAPGYLADKVPSSSGDWGLAIISTTNSTNTQLLLKPTLYSPGLFVQSFMDYIVTEPQLLSQFCNLVSQCNGNQCSAPTTFAVVLSDSGTGEFTATWTPAVSGVVSQMVKYRLQGDITWITFANISGANPQAANVTSALIKPGCTNAIIEFQIDSICGTGSNGTSVLHGIWYAQQTLSANIINGVITVTQNAMLTVQTIEYVLYSGANPLETVSATGSNPIASFSAVAPGIYTVQYRYSTSIDATLVSSDDVSQHGSYYVSGNITVS